MTQTKTAQHPLSSTGSLEADFPTSFSDGPSVLPAWKAPLEELISAAKAQPAAPKWWTDELAFFAKLEVQRSQSHYAWDGMRQLPTPAFFFFQFSLAGWGFFEHDGEPPRRIVPGTGFFAVVPSRHRYWLPKESPGWTFGWINVYHPYLVERISKRIAVSGPIVHFEPTSTFLASAMRVVSGHMRKDFRDPFEVELAIFEFVVAYERLVYQSSHPSGESERLLEAIQRRVLDNPRRTFNVDALAAEHGMSRSHFSHFFRARTGHTPARIVTQIRVQEAARMLLQSGASLRQIAEACGFANVSHFNRVFRRFQHISPGAYRKLLP